MKPSKQASFRDWCAVLGVALGAFMAILDIQIINASLREIQGALGLDLTEGSWISTSYLIAEIIVIPLTAVLSGAFGSRRYVVTNAVLFVLASILCGLSWNLPSMIAFRVVQGLTGGVLIPMSFQTIFLILPQAQRNIGLAIFGMTATLAPTLGPTLGGWLTDSVGWRFIFFINVLPGLAMVALTLYGLPHERLKLERLRSLDHLGALLLGLGLGTLTYILEEGASVDWFEDNAIRISFLTCIVSLGLFFARQLLISRPLLNLSIFRDRNFMLSAVITLFAAVALYGGVYATAVYLGQIQNYSSQQIGSTMMWIGIPQIFVLPCLPFLMRHFDLRLLALVGFFIFAFSNFANGQLDFNYASEQFRFSLILRAISQPLFMIPLSAMAMGRIRDSEAPDASAIYNMLRNLGGSFGIAWVSTFVVTRTNHHLSAHTRLIDPDNTLALSTLTEVQNQFLINRYTLAESKLLSLKQILETAYRESLIQSFSDIFFVLVFLLLTAGFLTLLLQKVRPDKMNSGVH